MTKDKKSSENKNINVLKTSKKNYGFYLIFKINQAQSYNQVSRLIAT